MEEIITFGDIEIKKKKFHQHKEPISIENIDINEIAVSNRVSLVKKDLNISLATMMQKKIRHLCIFLPKMTAYGNEFDETKYVFPFR